MAPPSQPTRLGSTKMQQNLESTVTWLSPYISIQGCLKQTDSDVPALAARLSSAQPSSAQLYDFVATPHIGCHWEQALNYDMATFASLQGTSYSMQANLIRAGWIVNRESNSAPLCEQYCKTQGAEGHHTRTYVY